MEVSRRDFLKVSGATAAGTVLFAGCVAPEREMLMESPSRLPEDTLSSFDQWYASVCQLCPAGCGIIVRVVEGRAKKIEGNPDHPVNQGKLCARGQAGLQALYNPDRIRAPLRRNGPRGSGRYQEIGWDDAIDELASRVKALQSEGNGDTIVMATEPLRGLTAEVVRRFANGAGVQDQNLLGYEPLDQTTLRTAMRQVFSQDTMPFFDIERSNYILSFGANFLEPWLSQVSYNRAYGQFRQGRAGNRGYLVQIEPRMSMTAANADEWIPITPGTEGVLALSIAYTIINQNLVSRAASDLVTANGGAITLNAYRPEEAARITGIPADRIVKLATEFAQRRPALALGGAAAAGHTNGLFNLTAIYTLNYLVENVGRPGGVLFNPPAPLAELTARVNAASFRDWWQLAQRMRTKQPKPVNMLLVHNANPLYGLPPAIDFGGGLKNVPVIVSFSSVMDETTAMADLILPDHMYLEGWSDDIPEPSVGYETIGLQQPVVNPLYNTRSFVDVLLGAAQLMGSPLKERLPWKSQKDALQEVTQGLFRANRGSIRATRFDQFWNGVLQRGGWWDTGTTRSGFTARPDALPRQAVAAKFAGDEKDYPYYLNIFEHNTLQGGDTAHLPWLQMAPDPTSTVMWQTWVEMNPRTAQEKGLRDGDVVRVEAPDGRSLEAGVYIYPAIPPNVIAIPTGQGHTYMGRYAEKRGANPLSILTPMIDDQTGGLAWNATRVRIAKTNRIYRLPKLEGNVMPVEPDDYKIVQITDLRGGH